MLLCEYQKLISNRAGCNFSALSASDERALRWDRFGYSHLKKLATEKPIDSFISHTPSTEMWDNVVPYEKIKDMSEYLEDVNKDSIHGCCLLPS